MGKSISGKRYFKRKASLEIEIGFGNGDFLVQHARENTQHNFLGIEIHWRPIKSTLRKIALAGTSNVRVLHMDARRVFNYFLPSRAVQRVYSLFPYPWPKKRHVSQRLFSKAFLKTINNRLADDGIFQMVTDDKIFLEWVIIQSRGTGFKSKTRAIDARFGTKFERIWQAQGRDKFYELILTKYKHMECPLKEGFALKTLHVKDFNPNDFSPSGKTEGNAAVKFDDWVFDEKNKRGLLYTVVAEEGAAQHFWIEIARRQKNWAIHIAKGGYVLPTRGVMKALELVRDACAG